MLKITGMEWADLVRKVFEPGPGDKAMAFLVDLPDAANKDDQQWFERRRMALEWAGELANARDSLGLAVHLYLYRATGSQNGDLPETAWAHRFGPLPNTADDLDPSRAEPFVSVFQTHSILIAPTQFSATAPLKAAAARHSFRAATMPGFTADMIPALRVDYARVARRCDFIKRLLDDSVAARIAFRVDRDREFRLQLDLRFRTAHSSGGLIPKPGQAGNLPSGETYIAPYEGEKAGEPSRSHGELPVQLGQDVVVYRIAQNRAVEVLGEGPVADAERTKLSDEPAYGNLSELGLGVLADLGIKPVGKVLLDEKLGLHIAFGRSEHLGGTVGPSAFRDKSKVVHIDRVYVPEMQPRITVEDLSLDRKDGSVTTLISDGRYSVVFPD